MRIAERRFALREGAEMTVKVYSNCGRVALFVNGKPFAELDGDKVFRFGRVPLDAAGTTVTAKGADAGRGENPPSDTVVFARVAAAFPGYRKPDEPDDDEGEGVKNWFDDLPLPGKPQEPVFNAGFYSIKDSLSVLLGNSQTERIVMDAIRKFSDTKIKKSMLGILGGASVESMVPMLSSDKEKAKTLLWLMNSELQKIRKE